MVSQAIFPNFQRLFCTEVLGFFASLVRMLKETEAKVTLVSITMNAPFECMEMWSYLTTYTGREGNQNLNIPSDPGLSEREALPVYETFDRVFAETFPALKELSRSDAAVYVQELMRKVSRELIEPGQDPRGTEEYAQLLKFSEGVVSDLKAP